MLRGPCDYLKIQRRQKETRSRVLVQNANTSLNLSHHRFASGVTEGPSVRCDLDLILDPQGPLNVPPQSETLGLRVPTIVRGHEDQDVPVRDSKGTH